LFVADLGNNKILKVTPGGSVSTFAGTGQIGTKNGAKDVATFSRPDGLVFDQSGNLYIVGDNFAIRKIDTDGIVSTFYTFNDNNERSFEGIAIDQTGNLYASAFSEEKIVKVLTSGYAITPQLPSGLNFDSPTGSISGTPSVVSP